MHTYIFVVLSLFLVACQKTKQLDPDPMPDVKMMSQSDSEPASTPIAEAQPDSAPMPEEKPVVVTPTETPSIATKTEAKPIKSYTACGCGCCGGMEESARKACLYRAKGDTFEKIIAADNKARKNPGCNAAGCSLGTKYEFCD